MTLAQVVVKRKVEKGEELLFDYGRAYWKKAYFFANSFAQPSDDAVAEETPEALGSSNGASGSRLAEESCATQIDRVLERLRSDLRLRRCCYRVAPAPDGDDSGDDDGVIYFLMDEVGSRVRTVAAEELTVGTEGAGGSAQASLSASESIKHCKADVDTHAEEEANEARSDRLLKLNNVEAQQEFAEPGQPEPEIQAVKSQLIGAEGRATSKMSRVGMALLHHLSEGVMYSLLWLREDAPAGTELVSVLQTMV